MESEQTTSQMGETQAEPSTADQNKDVETAKEMAETDDDDVNSKTKDNNNTSETIETVEVNAAQEKTMETNDSKEENAASGTIEEDGKLGENSNNPENDNKEGSGTNAKTDDHNSGSGFMADDEDFETPRNVPEKKTEVGESDIPASAQENQKPVFITEQTPREDQEGSDISGVRADTPNWEEDGGENDAASLSDVGPPVSQKPARSSAHSRARPLTRSTIHEEVAPGQRAVVNTPVSYVTATDFNAEVIRNIESRNTSHGGLESAREAVFQRAMTLMVNRCDSKQGTVNAEGLLTSPLDATYGPKCPQYFYVQQKKPAPMAPLKAWRGYHGNVYFEPMTIQKVGGGNKGSILTESQGAGRPTPSLGSCKSAGSRRTRAMTPASRSRALVPVRNGDQEDGGGTSEVQLPTRSTTRLTFKRGPMSAKSGASSRSVAAISQHHVLYLDKEAVTNPENSAMHEELEVIEKQQATGSLNIHSRRHFPQDVRPNTSTARTVARRSGASSAKFDRICRGSVAHKLRRAKSGGPLGNSMSRNVPQPQRTGNARNSQLMLKGSVNTDRKGTSYEGLKGNNFGDLVIVGDKFAPPATMSPLLRTQTQFSLSSQRMTVNSPDLYGAFDRLPPLEQVRISLRQMDASGDDSLGGRTTTPYSTGTNGPVIEELKPFIKYSPDVRAQYNKQLKFY